MVVLDHVGTALAQFVEFAFEPELITLMRAEKTKMPAKVTTERRRGSSSPGRRHCAGIHGAPQRFPRPSMKVTVSRRRADFGQ